MQWNIFHSRAAVFPRLFLKPCIIALVTVCSFLYDAAVGTRLLAAIPQTQQQAQQSCPSLPFGSSGPDFSNQDLSNKNFSRRDLRGANFSGATLKGTVFIGANLEGANFSNARVQASDREDLRPTDFTRANLNRACFSNMTFSGRTYFTYADISCTDFSRTNLASGLAIFGPSPLKIDESSCKPSFRGATMHCEFVADWPRLDLGSVNDTFRTDLSACASQLGNLNLDKADLNRARFGNAVMDGISMAGANLTGADLRGASLGCSKGRCANLANAILDNARLSNATLDGINLAGASMAGAQLDRASLQCVDKQCANLQQARLHGANLARANLSGANLYGASLGKGSIGVAATLAGAHLKNVNLSFSTLTGADFNGANFYSTYPGLCVTTEPNHGGTTRQCASAYKAEMTDTNFSNAYLYGVDFSAVQIRGGLFDKAVLTGASFAAASIGANSDGVPTRFTNAHLEGTDLAGAALLEYADLSNAYLDFRPDGNLIYLNLAALLHNSFACPSRGCNPPAATDVCLQLAYAPAPAPLSRTIICPDGAAAGADGVPGCGPARTDGGNLRWKSRLAPDDPAAWYANAATYMPAAAPASLCNGYPERARAGW
ncbi:pentapeptide repeat-containing protein|uniref:pentapeptide repeat-containing protein n=1 Tax=Noviherbaspirillum sp. L7-7A TaxID=2850560 RepID=UPI001C2C7C65|nr:pentapeptide repeat-containing protein [Noviherbaspirillum sp. L7-7A]MBV0878017.1 pentapeptide repeat-containing protein [Noviherbaspirillum sp. L7-7A]